MKLECAKYELVESLQRLLCNRPLASYDYLQIALPPSIVSTARYEQLIQQTKTRLMAVYLAGIEARINQYRIQVREQTHQMWQQHQQHIPDREMPSIFAELMDKRACVMKKKLSVINTFTIAYHVRSAYGRLENIYKGKEPDLYRIGFFSSLVIDRRVDTKARLSHGQRQLLRRGPTYVPPCQLHLSPTLSSVDDRIKKQYAPLQHQIALLFSLYGHDIARHENMKGEIKKEFKAFFSRTVPDAVLHRAIHEKQQIGSIRTMLKSHHWILRRTADHRNTFYLGERKDFEEKCDEYMQNQADQYQLLFTVDAQNRSHIQQKLAKRVQDLNTDLETLHKQKRFGKSVYETLRVNVDKVSLPYLYFLPELSAVSETIDYF